MTRLTTWLLVPMALLFSAQVAGADKWLQKKDAEELYAYVDTNGCPISTEELTELVHGLLIRSRIKPLIKWRPGDITIYVALDCVEADETSWIFRSTAMIAKIDQERDDSIIVSFRHEDDFGSFGKGGAALIEKSIAESAEKAFMKYLQANFDLSF